MGYSDFLFHHIGYVTDSIESTSCFYRDLGYAAGKATRDSLQGVYISFLTKEGFPTVELIEPIDEYSSVNKLLKKNGVSPYHICYEVNDIEVAFNELTGNQGFTPLFRPVEAVAMSNRKICYLYKKEVGLIELVNKS